MGAGPELAIPATKSFTTQLTILYLLALFLARKRGRMTSEVTRSYLQRLAQLPDALRPGLGPHREAAVDRREEVGRVAAGGALREWREIVLQHGIQEYRLRITAAGKLILTK